MSGPSFAAIDFEIATPSWSTACAVGVVLVDDGAVTGEHRYLIRPPDNLYGEFHAWLHGITPDDTAEAPDFPDVWSRVADLIGERIVVAHNAAFDFGVVRRSAAHWGYTCPELSFTCTYRLAQRAWPNRRTYRLDALTADLGVALDHHDPLSDARAAAQVALRLCAHCGLSSLADLAEHVHYPLGRLVAARPLHRMAPPPRSRTRRPRQGEDKRARQGSARGAPRRGRRSDRRVPIEELGLSPRACNALRRSGLTTIGQVLDRTREELLAIRNFGPKSYAELRGRLREMGYIDGSAPWPRRPATSLPISPERYYAPAAILDEDDDEEMSALGKALREALRDVGGDDLLNEDDAD